MRQVIRFDCGLDLRKHLAISRTGQNSFLFFLTIGMNTMKTTRTLLSTIIAVLAFVAATQTSYAQVVPFKASGDNAQYFPEDEVTTAVGKATHMGKVTASGIAFPDGDPIGPGKFEWMALDYEMTAANGDQICFHGGGELQFIPLGGNMFSAVWSGKFYIDGGTGRFANVSDDGVPLDVIAINDPFELDESGDPLPDDVWTYSWELNGDINLGKKGSKK
ncbi:MAG: hypothetical protein ACI814_003799 [Mariniblastus sp.]|jgi:hypothetical protein